MEHPVQELGTGIQKAASVGQGGRVNQAVDSAKAIYSSGDQFEAVLGNRNVSLYEDTIRAKGLAQGQPASVNAIDGLRAVYLAEAAGASLRLGKAIELKPNCEITWQ